MKLGTFLMPLHPPQKPLTESLDEDTEFVVRAEQLGFTEAWCGNHVTLKWEPIAANDLFMANLIARTSKIKLGIGVSVMTISRHTMQVPPSGSSRWRLFWP